MAIKIQGIPFSCGVFSISLFYTMPANIMRIEESPPISDWFEKK